MYGTLGAPLAPPHTSSPRGNAPPRHRGDLHAPEAGGEMHRHVLVALFEAVVLADVMQVVPTDDNGALHLHLGDHTWATEVGGRDGDEHKAAHTDQR